jgi:CheY-like chemotaxis protein
VALVLAIDPDFAHHDALQAIADDLAGHEIVFAPTRDEAIAIVSRQIPDLIVFPVACSVADEASLASRIRALPNSGHPHTIAIPLSAVAARKAGRTTGRWFYWFKPQHDSRLSNGDSAEFAERIRTFFDRPAEEASDRNRLELAPEEPTAAARIIVAALQAKRWLFPLAAAGVLAATVAIVPGSTSDDSFGTTKKPVQAKETKSRASGSAAAAPANQNVAKAAGPTGQVRVTSEPTGASVILDGENQGLTPLTIAGVRVGRHDVTVQSRGGVVRHAVVVKADQTATVDASVFSGWLAFFAPIELEILANGRALQFDEQHRAMLASGRYEIQFTSRELGFHGSRRVDIRPGQVTTVSLVPPRTTLTVTANERADVWVDGARVGETPLVDFPVNLGTHEVVVRHLAKGEQRRTVTATAQPTRVEIVFGG